MTPMCPRLCSDMCFHRRDHACGLAALKIHFDKFVQMKKLANQAARPTEIKQKVLEIANLEFEHVLAGA